VLAHELVRQLMHDHAVQAMRLLLCLFRVEADCPARRAEAVLLGSYLLREEFIDGQRDDSRELALLIGHYNSSRGPSGW